MDKVVKLESILNILQHEANEANEKAATSVGVDNNTDAYFQGLRNGYLQAIELLKQKSDQLA